MKILYISLDPRQPFNALTGGALHMREITRAFREEGHEVRVLAPGVARAPGETTGYSASAPRIIKKITPSYLWLLARDMNDIRLDRSKKGEIIVAIDRFEPEAVYERNSYLFASAARAAKERKIPYFMEVNAPTVEERREHFGAPLGGWHRRMEAFQRRLARGIVVVSEPLEQYLVESGVNPRKIIVAPNGVRPERFEGCRETGEQLRRRLGLEDGPVAGFLGSLAAYHGLERLIDAMPAVIEHIPAAKALVVGGGPLLGKFRSIVREKKLDNTVVFTGGVKPDDAPAYIGAFDIAVLPRTAEYCSPIKLFEYGAAGVPVIAPRTAPVESIFGEERAGVLLGDDQSLAEAIVSLLADPLKAAEMGAAFKKRALSNYTWRHTARRILAMMEEKLG